MTETNTHTLPLHDAMQSLIDAYHADVSQAEQLAQSHNALEQENTLLRLELAELKARYEDVVQQNNLLIEARKRDEKAAKASTQKAQMVSDKTAEIQQMYKQAQRQEAAAEASCNALKLTLKSYKEIGTPKKIREKIKNYQSKIAALQTTVNKANENTKTKQRELALAKKELQHLNNRLLSVDVTEVYKNNDDSVWIYPDVMQLNGAKEKEIALWYMNNNGIGALYTLDENNEAHRAQAPRAGIKPAKKTLTMMTNLLCKIKSNGGTAHVDDLKILQAA